MLFRPTIRLISPSLGGGGSERVCCLLANYWASQGEAVEILLVRDIGEFRTDIDSRVVITAAKKLRVRSSMSWLVSKLAIFPEVPAIAFGSDLGAVLGLLKRFRFINNCIIYREWSVPEKNVSRSRLWIYPEAIAYLNGVVAQTEYAKSSLGQLIGTRAPIVQIFNPCYGYSGTSVAGRSLASLSILSVGRLSAEKRFDLLIATLGSDEVRPLVGELVIAGDGPLREKLTRLVGAGGLRGLVAMPGFVSAIRSFYLRCDLFVLSSEYEGMPNALIEAITCGCRVLASGGGAVYELLSVIGLSDCYVRESEWGGAFANKIAHVLSISEDRWLAARSRLLQITDISIVAESYCNFAKSLAKKWSVSL